MITQPHCELCGSTDREYVDALRSYSSCCNELIITGGCVPGRCAHDGAPAFDDAAEQARLDDALIRYHHDRLSR